MRIRSTVGGAGCAPGGAISDFLGGRAGGLGGWTITRNAGATRLTCRHFGISPQFLYHWLRGYHPRDLCSLESRRRPKRVRQPTWERRAGTGVLELRGSYPRWRKGQTGGLAVPPGTRTLSIDGGPHWGEIQSGREWIVDTE
jgi:hypothetical protein